jgi:hypothetical protein
VLERAGFEIRAQRGILEMPETCATGRFHYSDFVLGSPITENPEAGYILFLDGEKPGS